MKNKYAAFRFKTFLKIAGRQGAIGFTSAFAATEIIVLLAPPTETYRTFFMIGLAGSLLSVSLVRALIAQARLAHMKFTLSPTHDVRVYVDDFMENLKTFPRASCVFGVNDEYSVVGLKKDSIHQAFLNEYFADASEVEQQFIMDQAVNGALDEGQFFNGEVKDRRNLAHGTVVRLPFEIDGSSDRNAFMLANSRRADHGFHGSRSTQNLLGQIWLYHQEHKLVTDELLFALVGSGHSKDLSKTRSLVRIIDEFFEGLSDGFARTNINRLILSVPEATVMSGEVNLEAVHQYIRSKIAVQRELI